MSSTFELDKYNDDKRTPCKYGDKCYQKNPAHHEKFKHPPKKVKRKGSEIRKPPKRVKHSPTPEPTTNEQSKNTEKTNSHNNAEKDNQSSNEKITGDKNCSKESPELEEAIPQTQFPEDTENESFDLKTFVKKTFLVELPDDFYKFWDFCEGLNPEDPSSALKDINLNLIGPYDVLAGKFKNIKKSPEEYLRHWRYYYDPPEVLTVIKGSDRTGYHIGYFFDSPEEFPTFLVSNHGTKDGVFTKMGDNIFTAVSIYIEDFQKNGDPFKKMKATKILSSLKTEAEKLKLNLSSHSKKIKERQLKVVASTYNKIGLVVPYNKKTQLGYRELAVGDKELMTLLNKLANASPEQKPKYLSDLQPVLTYASIALDECDFGTGIKLGWELLYHGIDSLNSTISRFLSNSYKLLNKEAFAKIIEAHMKDRKKGCNLSIV